MAGVICYYSRNPQSTFKGFGHKSPSHCHSVFVWYYDVICVLLVVDCAGAFVPIKHPNLWRRSIIILTCSVLCTVSIRT